MGTSQSSKGPKGGVPLVPPWVPDAPAPPADPPQNPEQEAGEPSVPQQLASPSRFTSARISIGKFASEGGSGHMRSGVGQFVKGGYGGASQATRRFAATANTAGLLYSVLSGQPGAPSAGPAGQLDRALLDGRSADDVMDAVVEAVRPVDGTQDAEASRASIKEAMVDLLERFPDAALLDLEETQKLFVIERFVAFDVFRRFCLDLESTIHQKAPSATEALSRLKEVKAYIREAVTARFVGLAAAQISAKSMPTLVSAALKETFEVFESYVK